MISKRIYAICSALMLTVCGCLFFSSDISAEGDGTEVLDFRLTSPETVGLVNKQYADGTETVRVGVETVSNPGVQSWTLLIGYDTAALEFKGIEGGMFNEITAADNNGAVIVTDFEDGDIGGTGTAFTAVFTLKKGTSAGSYQITLTPSPDEDNFFNYDDETIPCTVSQSKAAVGVKSVQTAQSAVTAIVTLADTDVSGGIDLLVRNERGLVVAGGLSVGAKTSLGQLTAGKYTLEMSKDGYAPLTVDFTVNGSDLTLACKLCRYGDVNGDGKVDLDDVAALQQWLVGWNVQLSYANAADADVSGSVDLNDLAVLQQYLAGWNIRPGENR